MRSKNRKWQTKWTDESLAEAVAKSRSIRQTLLYLGLSASGANYQAVPRRIKELGINNDHWTGQGWNTGKDFIAPLNPYQWDLEEILIKDSPYKGGTRKLKIKLLKSGLLENKCERCEIENWNNKPLSIQLHHKNGISTDNRIENLQMLCPNCHSQTDTFCRRKK